MNRRTLGTAGPTVASIGLGCMGLSAVYDPGTVSEADGIAVIRRAIDLGVTLLDTSDAYGPYRNEELVGRAVAGRRDEVVIATKAGCVPHTESFVPRPDGRPEVLRRCCDESLARLGVDVIDLWQLHRRDPAVPIEDSVGAMGDMVAAGKVRAIGVSEVTLDELRAAQATHPIATLQSELSLWTRDLRTELLPWCEAVGIGVIAFSPLGRGFLTGRFGAGASFVDGDARAVNPRFAPTALAANQDIVTASGPSPTAEAPPPPRSRWRGCWRRARPWCRSRARRRSPRSRRTWRRRRWPSTPTTWPRSRSCPRRSASGTDRTGQVVVVVTSRVVDDGTVVDVVVVGPAGSPGVVTHASANPLCAVNPPGAPSPWYTERTTHADEASRTAMLSDTRPSADG